jgi:cytochrome c-type biogenesis protein CcmE
MKPKTIIGLVLMAAFGSLLLLNFGDQVGGYMSFAQAEASGSKAHVVGTWAEQHPMQYDRQANVFTFHMRDEDGRLRQVRYANPKPANFEEAEQLVVEGYAQGDQFVAEHILVKCPSKYNDAKGLEDAQAARTN